MLHERRLALGLTLEQARRRTRGAGCEISAALISKIENGTVEPGIPRLHALFRSYDLPLASLGDFLLRDSLPALPPQRLDPTTLLERGFLLLDSGDLGGAIAHLMTLREPREGEQEAELVIRLRATAALAIGLARSGQIALAKRALEGILIRPPADALLLADSLRYLAECWWLLGSAPMALALLERAVQHAQALSVEAQRSLDLARSSALLAAGEARSAEQLAEAARVRWHHDDPIVAAAALGVRLRASERLNRLDGGSADHPRFTPPTTGSFAERVMLGAARALWLLEAGEVGAAVIAADESFERATTVDEPRVKLAAAGALWMVARATGDAKRGRQAMASASQPLEDLEELDETVVALRIARFETGSEVKPTRRTPAPRRRAAGGARRRSKTR